MKKAQSDLDAEWNFSDLPPAEGEAACKYEYMRESQALRNKLEAARSKDQKERVKEKRENTAERFLRGETVPWGGQFRLRVALLKAGFPKPWNQLTKAAREELVRVISQWYAELKKSYPPVVIKAGVAERDYERERASPIWRLTLFGPESHWPPKSPTDSFFAGQSKRKYFYGFIRINEGYNRSEAVEAFRAWFKDHWPETKGGGSPKWQAKLNDLVVMRLSKRFRDDSIKRVEHVAKFTTAGFKGCKEWCDERCKAKKAKLGFVDQPMSKAANQEMSRARADARKFFQSFFPSERPLSY